MFLETDEVATDVIDVELSAPTSTPKKQCFSKKHELSPSSKLVEPELKRRSHDSPSKIPRPIFRSQGAEDKQQQETKRLPNPTGTLVRQRRRQLVEGILEKYEKSTSGFVTQESILQKLSLKKEDNKRLTLAMKDAIPEARRVC